MLRSTACLMALTVAMCATLAAQDKPDFSGRWILEAASPRSPHIALALTVRQSIVRTNVRGEPIEPFFRNLAAEREFEHGTRSDVYQIGVIGGIVPGVSADGRPAEGPSMRHSVTWEGDALVIYRRDSNGRTAASGAWAERREVWSLDEDGRLRVAVTTRGSAEPARTAVAFYRRRRDFEPQKITVRQGAKAQRRRGAKASGHVRPVLPAPRTAAGRTHRCRDFSIHVVERHGEYRAAGPRY